VIASLGAVLVTSAALGQCPGSGGDCCVANGTPGCDDVDCCNAVCAQDSFCCTTSWDGICAGEAQSKCKVCFVPPGDNNDCADRITVTEGQTPFTNAGATQDGPSLCGLMGSDIWYNYVATATGDVTIDTFGSGYDTVLSVYDGCDCPPGANLGCNDDSGGTLQSQLVVPVVQGNCYKIQLGGFNGAQGTGVLNITAGGPPPVCGPGNGDCFSANGTPGCDDKECCNAVCAVDPFCCDVSWDGICASEALELCVPACKEDINGDCEVSVVDLVAVILDWDCVSGAGSSTCCFASGGLGCDDKDCTNAVCAQDSFCCATAWDGICADEALAKCEICQPCVGDVTNDGQTNVEDLVAVVLAWGACEGCGACCLDDGSCVQALPAVCNTDLGGAFQGFGTACSEVVCVAICGKGAGDCFIANGTPGCDDVECCTTVCAIDPFCCDVSWDQICADEAVTFCAEPCNITCSGMDEGEACGTDTNGGCNSTPPVFGAIACGQTKCGTDWADGGTRDTDWYQVVTTAASTTLTATLTAEISSVVFVVSGIPACAPVVVGQTGASVQCAAGAPAIACVEPGTYVIFVATSVFDGFPCGGPFGNDYSVSLTCETSNDPCPPPAVCGPGNGDCCSANGTPGCDDVDCCVTVCAADPFCCDVAWDGICADEALDLCIVCAASDCCFPHETPGCDDPDCEAIVCGLDPFCCDTQWDQVCADSAQANCGICGPPPPCPGQGGDCCVANGTPGCDDVACCEAVCAIDPFCCDTAWDGICAGEAATLCKACMAPPCEITCSGTPEGEACMADTNGGCNSTPPMFGSVSDGATICGIGWAAGGTRDTDWYSIALSAGQTITATATSEFSSVTFIVDGIATCAPVVIGATGSSSGCAAGTPASASITAAATYVVFVAPGVFDGIPCGGNNDYSVTVDVTP
jgi:hypothetical protein